VAEYREQRRPEAAKDVNWDAYYLGTQHFLEDRELDPWRFQDADVQQEYTIGWHQECNDLLEATKTPDRRRR
jgi:hypothetical protein